MIQIKKNKRYGRCAHIEFSTLKIIVTLDLGPRIVHFGIDNKNLIFEDKNETITKDSSALFSVDDPLWRLYAGHRIWKSPEYDDTYYPDNVKCDYEIVQDGIIIKSPIEKKNNIQKILDIKVITGNKIRILNKIVSFSEESKEIACWAITAFKAGGCLSINTNDVPENQFLPNRNIVLWPYSSILDKRLRLGDEKIEILASKNKKYEDVPFKMGVLIKDEPIVSYSLGKHIVTKKINDKTRINPIGFVDRDCNIEIYTNNKMIEIESLSSLYNLEKGDEIILEEEWEIIPLN